MKRALRALVPAAVAALAWAPRAAAERSVYAIVIGNNAPPTGASTPSLHYADDDAVRYAELLGRAGARVALLSELDRDTQRRYPGVVGRSRLPTLGNVRQAVSAHQAAMRADLARGVDPLLYFVFSGHGAIGGDGAPFLALADGAITRHVLYDEVLAALPASSAHLIVDACHASGVVGVRDADGPLFGREVEGETVPLSPVEMKSVADRETLRRRFPHVGALVATSTGQEAHEWSEIEAGVFSHEVLSALVGAADVNSDRRIEYTEVQAFVAAANRELDDPRAVPRMIASPPGADERAVLIDLASLRGVRRLSGPAGRLGHFHIELAGGQRYLDAHLGSDLDVSLAVPAGVALFVRNARQEANLPAGAAGDVSLADLRFAPRSVRPRGSVETSLRSALFAAPYSQTYYKGFVDSVGALSVRFGEPALDLSTRVAAPPRRPWPALALAGGSAVAGAAALVAGGLAISAWRDFEATDQQAAAKRASDRFQRRSAFAAGAAGAAVLTALAAWWLWPDAEPALTLGAAADPSTGRLGLEIGGRW